MRIISGSARGRRLAAPRGKETTRPLPDRVRTSVFNMLTGHIEDQHVVDAFAGTGSFGLEALSRGAASCVFFEKDKAAIELIERNASDLGMIDRAQIVSGDALGASALSRVPRPLHIVMMDPPYDMLKTEGQRTRVFDQLSRFISVLDDEGFALLRTPWPFVEYMGEQEHRRKIELNLSIDRAIGPETHAYGTTAVHWYMRDKGSGNRH